MSSITYVSGGHKLTLHSSSLLDTLNAKTDKIQQKFFYKNSTCSKVWQRIGCFICIRSAVVPIDMVMAGSYRLSVETVSLSAAVWPWIGNTSIFGGVARCLRCIGPNHYCPRKQPQYRFQLSCFSLWTRSTYEPLHWLDTTLHKHVPWRLLEA